VLYDFDSESKFLFEIMTTTRMWGARRHLKYGTILVGIVTPYNAGDGVFAIVVFREQVGKDRSSRVDAIHQSAVHDGAAL